MDRLRDIVETGGGVNGRVPGDWFPLELSLEKNRDNAPESSNPRR